MPMLNELATGLIDLLYPPVCLACDQVSTSQICSACRDDIQHDPFPTCPRCGSSVGPHSDTTNGCPRCHDERFAFAGVVRMGPYEGLRRDLILRMKCDELTARAVSAVFAERIAPAIEKVAPSVVIPIPLHWKRRWRRGYNQAEVLANAIANQLRVPCQPGLLRRTRSTSFQSGLSATARRENLQNAMSARHLHKYKDATALLVDDVFTTGSTAHVAAAALKAAGMNRVYVAVVAHG